MIASPGKPDAVSLNAGLGRVRARTIAFGAHVIAIENIGTIRIVRGRRSWWLFAIGALLIGVAATQLNTYGAIAIASIVLGAALVIGDLAQRVESGLSIGSSDGCSTLLVSRDQVFLQRLLQLLTDKIDSKDDVLLATFDIATGRITVMGPAVKTGEDVSIAEAPVARVAPQAPAEPAADSQAPAPSAPTGEDDPDDGLFGEAEAPRDTPDDSAPSPAPDPVLEDAPDRVVAPKAPPAVPAAVALERRASFDPLLDGGGRTPANDDEWLDRLREASQPPRVDSGGGAARLLLALLIVALLGSGVFAAWYFTGQTGPASSISLVRAAQGAE